MATVESFVASCCALLLGHVVRSSVPILQSLHIPSSVVGGIITMFILQLCKLNEDVSNYVESHWVSGWDEIPGFLINIVFSVMFLGVEIPTLQTVWLYSGPQFVYGQLLGWAQWVIGLGLGSVMASVFDDNQIFGVILPIGFEGGHGTAAGMGSAFDSIGYNCLLYQLGKKQAVKDNQPLNINKRNIYLVIITLLILPCWPQGKALSLASATFGIVFGILIGIGLIKWNENKSKEQGLESPKEHDRKKPRSRRHNDSLDQNLLENDYIEDLSQETGLELQDVTDTSKEREHIEESDSHGSSAIDEMALQLSLLGIACLFGYAIKQCLLAIQSVWPWAQETKFFDSFPLFPMCMLGGIMLQLLLVRTNKAHIVNVKLMSRLGGLALDFLVTLAVAKIKISAVSDGIIPFFVLMIAGIILHVSFVLFVAPSFFPDFWFERAIPELGHSMGVTATGLLLLRIVDPDAKTPVYAAFSYKLLLHEPVMGGGIWTSTAVPLANAAGPWVIVGIGVVVIIVMIAIWWFALLPTYGPAYHTRLGKAEQRRRMSSVHSLCSSG